MLWIRKDVEAEQVLMQSSDLTAAVLRLLDRSILVVSVYVEVGEHGSTPKHDGKAALANLGNTFLNRHPNECR